MKYSLVIRINHILLVRREFREEREEAEQKMSRKITMEITTEIAAKFTAESTAEFVAEGTAELATKDTTEMAAKDTSALTRDRIRGCLIGGAVGDALGYPVEFLYYSQIIHHFGEKGITEYDLDAQEGKAVISDDTQMTLFTAEGLLNSAGKETEKIPYEVYRSYLNWYQTQMGRQSPESGKGKVGKANPGKINSGKGNSRLMEIPELYVCRAPGSTCLSALSSGRMGDLEESINMSKGCGGIMRVAPAALYRKPDEAFTRKEIDLLGAQLAAITHGHPLGYIPAAVLAHIVSVGVYGGSRPGMGLADAVKEALETAQELFPENGFMPKLAALLDRAVELAGNEKEDIENIGELGGGWVAEEALAIAVYCSVRYCDDFSKGVIAAVNHSGDSDSTGAVTGNILGAWLGLEGIGEKWLRDLELRELILEMADHLCLGCGC